MDVARPECHRAGGGFLPARGRWAVALGALLLPATHPAARAGEPAATNATPPVPAFSVAYMDRSVSPAADFYHYADGQWLKDNPVPADKSRWASFSELAERNWYLIHGILDEAAEPKRLAAAPFAPA